MSELDPVHDALERLEWSERNEEETPVSKFRQVSRRAALTGGAAGIVSAMLAACGSSSSKTQSASATPKPQSGGGGGLRRKRDLRLDPEAEVRAGQPRHHESVLRAHEVRRRGRLQAAGVLVPVDGLGELERQRDGQRHEHRHHRRCERHRRLPDRREGVQRAHRRGAEGEDPRRRLQRRRAKQPARLHRPGPVPVRAGDGQPHHLAAAQRRRRGAVHRHAGLGEHPAAHRRRAELDQEVGQEPHAAHDRHRRGPSRPSCR